MDSSPDQPKPRRTTRIIRRLIITIAVMGALVGGCYYLTGKQSEADPLLFSVDETGQMLTVFINTPWCSIHHEVKVIVLNQTAETVQVDVRTWNSEFDWCEQLDPEGAVHIRSGVTHLEQPLGDRQVIDRNGNHVTRS